jgi:hypothetical protein
MAHSSSELSVSDHTPDVECSQPQIVHPTNEIETSFEELCDQQTDHTRKSNTEILASRCQQKTYLSMLFILATKIQAVKTLIDDSKADKTPELSWKTIPVPLEVIPSVKSRDIQPLPESSKFKIKFLI